MTRFKTEEIWGYRRADSWSRRAIPIDVGPRSSKEARRATILSKCARDSPRAPCDVASCVPGAVTMITTGGGADTVRVRGTSSPLVINAGADDAIDIGDGLNTLDPIQGRVDVYGQGGKDDTLTINDQGSTTPHTYTVGLGSVQRSCAAPISFTSIEGLTLNQGPLTGNTSPQVESMAITQTVRMGQPATLSGRLADAVKADPIALAVDWGDGSAPTRATPRRKPFDLKHRFAEPGTPTVRVIWTDSRGQSNFREMKIEVTPAAFSRQKPGKGAWL
jgi:hypothetical protein